MELAKFIYDTFEHAIALKTSFSSSYSVIANVENNDADAIIVVSSWST